MKSSETRLPGEFSLFPNYPNPFNPTTSIRFALPRQAHVTLAVYNILGEKVMELVNGEVETGYHEVRFDGSPLFQGLGVYFYRMEAGAFVQIQKSMLLK